MAEGSRDQIDSAFHGYEPLRIVDDVINSFNDCALRRGSPPPPPTPPLPLSPTSANLWLVFA